MNYINGIQSALDYIEEHLTGDISERFEQEGNFFVTTSRFQNILKELADDQDTQYAVYTNFNDNGYDCYIASKYSIPKLPISSSSFCFTSFTSCFFVI